MVSMDEIREQRVGGVYPVDRLEGCQSALVLFAAAFLGRQDAIFIADVGMTATCVDLNAERLNEMVLAYPDGWEYVVGDAFEYATRTGRQWDVVSVDCFTNQFDRCAELLPLWCLLANRAVILGTDERPLTVPVGWELTERRYRSSFNGGVYWAVIEKC